MKISLNWLKDYVSTNIAADELAHKLTMAGLEVEAVESIKGDKVFELEVTPNRSDCLNMIGVSREVSRHQREFVINGDITTTDIEFGHRTSSPNPDFASSSDASSRGR